MAKGFIFDVGDLFFTKENGEKGPGFGVVLPENKALIIRSKGALGPQVATREDMPKDSVPLDGDYNGIELYEAKFALLAVRTAVVGV